MEAYGDGYMEPEEEWEREGLLDPAWEKQQKKVSELYVLLAWRSNCVCVCVSVWGEVYTVCARRSKAPQAVKLVLVGCANIEVFSFLVQ